MNLVALYLPGGLAFLGMAGLIWKVGRKYFGDRAALFGALAIMLTSAGAKGFGLARTDSLFAFLVTAAAFLGWRAWNRGGGWTWFWLAAAGATLTKGPLGLVFASGGLLACFCERTSAERLPLKGTHLAGVVLFFGLTLGWFLLACRQLGEPVLAKLVGKELVGHAIQSGSGDIPGMSVWKQPVYYLCRGFPWSLLAYYGLWRLWRQPAALAGERRFERFLGCWFPAGLVPLALAPHQRGDLLWPLMPAGALLAGREMARVSQRLSPARVTWLASVIAVLGVILIGLNYFRVMARRPIIRQTVALQQLAAQLEHEAGREFPLTHRDAPFALQIYLNTLRPPVSAARAAELLGGPDAAFVAVEKSSVPELVQRAEDRGLFLLETNVTDLPDCLVQIVSNRPTPETGGSFAFAFGRLTVRATGAELLQATEREFCLAAQTDAAEVRVTNESQQERFLNICWFVGGRHVRQSRTLSAGESWRATSPPNQTN